MMSLGLEARLRRYLTSCHAHFTDPTTSGPLHGGSSPHADCIRPRGGGRPKVEMMSLGLEARWIEGPWPFVDGL
jgi:hypothetical protein